MLDQCPADYRTYAAWRRHPLVLAWLTVQHLEGQLAALRTAYRGMRVDLADQVAADALTDVLEVLSAEGARLVASRRSGPGRKRGGYAQAERILRLQAALLLVGCRTDEESRT